MKLLIKNIANLGFVQIVVSLTPIVTLPHLYGTLLSVDLGVYIYAQIIFMMLQSLTYFGTEITGVSESAKYKNNAKKISVIFGRIMSLRLLMVAITTILQIIILNVLGLGAELIFLMSCQLFISIFVNRWVCIGTGKLYYYSMPIVLSKLSSIPIILNFITESSDINLLYEINLLVYALPTVLSFLLYLHFEEISIWMPRLKSSLREIKRKFPLFISNVLSNLKDRLAEIVIGPAIGMEVIPLVDLANKIINLASTAISIFTSSFQPLVKNISSSFSLKRIKTVVFLISSLPFFSVILLNEYIFILIEQIFSMNFFEMKWYVAALAFSVFSKGYGNFIGVCVLIANNKINEYSSTLKYSAIINIILMSVVSIVFTVNLNLIALLIFITMLFEILHRVYMVSKVT